MTSGVKVADNVKHIYNEMKVVKQDADHRERIRLVVFEISNGFIDVEEGKTFREKDLDEDGDAYSLLQKELNPKKCRYILYDCHFENKESIKKEELVFLMWTPDTASIKDRMSYASSKSAMNQEMSGVKHVLEINDLSDICTRNSFAKEVGKTMTTLEGKSVNPAE